MVKKPSDRAASDSEIKSPKAKPSEGKKLAGADKLAVKKVAAKKTATKKAVTKKSTAKKSTSQKTPAKKAAAKKVPVEKKKQPAKGQPDTKPSTTPSTSENNVTKETAAPAQESAPKSAEELADQAGTDDFKDGLEASLQEEASGDQTQKDGEDIPVQNLLGELQGKAEALIKDIPLPKCAFCEKQLEAKDVEMEDLGSGIVKMFNKLPVGDVLDSVLTTAKDAVASASDKISSTLKK
ncbi:hypothetical protein V5T82_16360 [Magnetovibrio sp. PR-2]|uniref:hypothetical protein n=1 Tax=Magnetovibrio sp. PR-2 TaxID=3120356 RepID=UPI002FCE1FA2